MGGVRVVRPAPPVSVVVARAEADGWDVAVVDGRGVHDKASALAAVAVGAEFPAWFGHNLDALADCLADLSWRPGDRHLLVWTHAGRLDLLDEGDRTGLVAVLEERAEGERLAIWLLD